jgi:molybdenum cofactor cytidylyltransferase
MLHAVIPAAGLSRRMGQPKLLLPLGGEPVIARLLRALRAQLTGGRVVVVCRKDDTALAEAVRNEGAELVTPDIEPPDMRTSIEHGLRSLNISDGDGWLLCPADHPLVEPSVVERLVSTWRSDPSRIVIPTFQGRRGHPVLFPGALAAEVFALPADAGVNALVRTYAHLVQEVPVKSDSVVADLDTPEDYERWQARL